MGRDEDFNQVILELTDILAEPAEEDRVPGGLQVPEKIDVAAIRRRMGLSQPAFAFRIGVPVATIRNWEQGHRSPQGPARVLLALLDRNPQIVEETLGSGVSRKGIRQSRSR